jgi:hypothetical protein
MCVTAEVTLSTELEIYTSFLKTYADSILITIYAPIIYTPQYVMVLMWANAFTRARGRALDPGN